MKTKTIVSAYILRGAAVMLLLSCVIVALSLAVSLPGRLLKAAAPQNNTTFGVNKQESAASVAAPAIQRNRTLTFADRVAYQRAIEEVYWQHRIWPSANTGPKPPLDNVMSREQIEKKVEDYLRNSQMLEDYWPRPITPDQLQAEMERIASHTKQPEVLHELFAALGNDPFVIAECLARPVLAERLLTKLNDEERVKLTRIAWRKQPFAIVGYQSGNAVPVTMAAVSANYTLPVIASPSGGCTEDTWTFTSVSKAPAARYGHTAVWTGSEMIIWGGTDDTSFFNTGARYDPSTDSWTATSTTNAPSGRTNHTAVWTGSEMIVWSGSGNTNTGGRYDPSTDSWTATSTTNAPAGRFLHTAVWTGSEMIVWGGYNGSELNTGGRYNPNTDSWTATSTTNAPDGRFYHTAVWSGSEMIVWGGTRDSVSGFNTGGRYNPSTDSWTATSLTNAPTGRAFHTAVWTGSEMIVWGGTDFTSVFNTGGRYNPSTDSWTATTPTNVPDARDRHTAVWTGSEMIVWGGDHQNTPLNTGGRYYSGIDIWIGTSTTNAPAARSGHTAVWDDLDSQMIVWGGTNYATYFNTGGRYCAQTGPPPTPTPTPTASPTPTTIFVTNTNDNGPGSLRNALAIANDGDTIDATGISGTILLINGELQITHNVTISGPGAGNLAVNGNATSRVFENFASNVTVSGFTITNGLSDSNGGGGILNHRGLTLSDSSVVSNIAPGYLSLSFGGGINSNGGGPLTVTNSVLSDNTGNGGGIAISGGGTLTVTSSVISNNDSNYGGGIYADSGTVTVSNSTINGNTGGCPAGGGIATSNAQLTVMNSTISGNMASNAQLTVMNSTISGNMAGNTLGGCINGAFGGGIYSSGGTVTITNSTISGNLAHANGENGDGGGIYVGSGGTLTVTNSTISANEGDITSGAGGGVYNGGGTLTVTNCTLSGNVAGQGGAIDNGGTTTLGDAVLNAGASGGTIFNSGGTVTSLGYNLASDDGGGVLTAPGDQINTDPMLGSLQNNGGPTFTHALLPGSPAIDAGDPNFTPPPFFDQRGPRYHRAFNGRIDVGSLEVQPSPVPTPRPRPTPHPRP